MVWWPRKPCSLGVAAKRLPCRPSMRFCEAISPCDCWRPAPPTKATLPSSPSIAIDLRIRARPPGPSPRINPRRHIQRFASLIRCLHLCDPVPCPRTPHLRDLSSIASARSACVRNHLCSALEAHRIDTSMWRSDFALPFRVTHLEDTRKTRRCGRSEAPAMV